MIPGGGASFGPLLDAIVGDARRAAASAELAAIKRAQERVGDALGRLPADSRARTHLERVAAETALAGHRLEPACAELARLAEMLAARESGDLSEQRLRDLTFARLRGELGLCGDRRALTDARRLLREISTDRTVDGALRRDAALTWGDLTWRTGMWRESASAYELAIDQQMEAINALMLRRDREAELRFASEAAPRAALAHARDGAAWRAAEAIERGRAMLMNPRDFTGRSEDRSAVRTLIEEAATGVALVYVIPEGETGLAIVVRGQAATTLELPRLTTASLSDRLGGVVDAKHSRIAPHNAWFFDMGAWLWDVAMGPILAAVKGGGLVLVACGLTSALPLHAAWRPSPTRRRYVLEDVVIRYALNARWARGEYAAGADYRSVLAVGNPRNRLPALRHAEDEIRAIPPTLDVERLVGGDASRPEILQRWGDVDILHFACHGRGSVDDPLSGGVMLADDLMLTARNVIDRRLDAHPLVILSACETAIIGARLPDEVVSLQSAFLAAGARGVVATLWPVDDELTARLISRFYQELVDRRRSPAAALRQSQRWMIAATEPSEEEQRRGWPAQSVREAVGAPPPTWAAFTYAGL
jgi:hypothetical protein